LEITDEEPEEENNTIQLVKGTGRRKGKTQAKRVDKKAAMLALDQQDEVEDVDLPLEGRPTEQDSTTQTGNMQDGTTVISKKARLSTAKEKGKQVVSKRLDLGDSSDTDEPPFSTRESGSSDESDESDEEDGGEGPKGGKGKNVSATNDYLSIFPTLSNSLVLHLARHACTPTYLSSLDSQHLHPHPPQSHAHPHLPRYLHQQPAPLSQPTKTPEPLLQSGHRFRVLLPRQTPPRYPFYPLGFQFSDVCY
jgi:hypothetical protein